MTIVTSGDTSTSESLDAVGDQILGRLVHLDGGVAQIRENVDRVDIALLDLHVRVGGLIGTGNSLVQTASLLKRDSDEIKAAQRAINERLDQVETGHALALAGIKTLLDALVLRGAPGGDGESAALGSGPDTDHGEEH